MLRCVALPLAACLLVAGGWFPAFAGSVVELTPIVGYRHGGSTRETGSGADADIQGSPVYGLILDIKAREDGQYEFIYTHQSTELDAKDSYTTPYQEPPKFDTGLQIDTIQAGGLLFLTPGTTTRPYIAMTLGASLVEPQDSDLSGGTYFSGSFAGGVKLYPSENATVRLEARGYGILVSDSSEIACSSGRGGGVCFVGATGGAIWKIEASVGLALRF